MKTTRLVQWFTLKHFPCDVRYNTRLKRCYIEDDDLQTPFRFSERLRLHLQELMIKRPLVELYVTHYKYGKRYK